MNTLFVFGHEAGARRAGFRNTNHRHPRDPTLLAWWPGLEPDALRGIELSIVVVTDEAFRLTEPGTREMANLVRGLETAKHMLRHGNQVWIDL